MLKLIYAVSVGLFDVCENMICSHYERASEKQKIEMPVYDKSLFFDTVSIFLDRNISYII